MSTFSRSSEYAIRALTYLAQQRGDRRYHLVRDMAQMLAMPAAFLGKILQPLVNAGILDSQRGRKGGYRLARDPEQLTLYDIVDTQDRLDRPRQCLLGQAECSDERACPLHDYWKEAHAAFHSQLSGRTLADLVSFCERRPDSGYPARIAPGAAPG